MDKMTFASYKFKPSDVIEGLNRYFAETKANRYRRVPLEIRRGVCYNNPDCVKDITFTNSRPEGATKDGWRCWNHYLICDPEEVVGVAINWLREEHDIFYTPGMEVPGEGCDIFCEEKLDMVPVAKVREALGIAEDSDIFEAIRVLKKSDERAHSEMYNARGEKYELLKQVREILNLNPEVNLFDALRHARGDIDSATRLRLESSELSHRNRELCRRLADIRKAAGMAVGDPSDLVEYVKALREKSGENSVLRSNLDYFANLAQVRQKTLANLQYEIDNVYREIFDCSNGDPEGTYKETLNDILTEYKRVLKLKDVAEEKTIKYKELARENEEKLKGDSTSLDRYARLRSNICTALCLGGETSDEDILKRVRMTKECHDKLCKDYTKLHDDYVASQKQVKGFTNRCDSLENLQRDLWNLRRNAIEDLKNRGFFFRPEENETLPEIYDKLLKRYDDYFGRYKEQYRLRQQWHVRYESEHERANGVQKKLDKLRGIEAERDKYKKNCKYWSDMYSSSEAACGALKGKIRELQEERTKVISAIGQDILDDCLK